jgi:DNA-binding NarL/FixJ family response regulator
MGGLPDMESILSTLSEVKQPVLVMHAANDQLLPLAAAKTIAANLGNATLRVLDSEFSFAPLTDPGAIEEAVTFLGGNSGTLAASVAPSVANLSQRETEVLRLIAAGRTNAEIASDLALSASTVSHHVTSILTKTGLGNRTEAASYAHRHHLA